MYLYILFCYKTSGFMKNIIKFSCLLAVTGSILLGSCTKDNSNNPPVPHSLTTTVSLDTAGTLKAFTASTFANMGMAVTYSSMLNIPAFVSTVKREANIVTFGNELKEGSVVANDGTYNYTTADALYTLCANAGLNVYGHTLVWYSQQNATYLNGLIAAAGTPGTGGTPAPNLLAGLNGDFETGSGTTFTGWSNLVGGTAAATFASATGNNSTRALQVTVTTADGTAYDVQSIGPQFNVTSGHSITISIDIKASVSNGDVRVVVQNSSYVAHDIVPTTAWATYTFSLTVNEATPDIRLNFPDAGTYTVDNIVITDPTQATGGTGGAAATPAQAATVIDAEMKRYITTTMTHYTGKINAWDVVNEALLDNGAIRNNTNYAIPSANLTNQFLYGQYLGSKYDVNNYVLKAFQYAKLANPTALRFINDYNLEESKAKVDSMKALVTFINSQGALIDGIGTQMHLNLGITNAGIDYCFQTLASTGLKVRISELDVALNSAKSSTFIPTTQNLLDQQTMYQYVIASYIKNVPAAQRYGVTVWGVSDTDSWLNVSGSPDVPLLFDAQYKKNATYAGFKMGTGN
jgi:endo-1,4-beta-xylanase